MREASKWLHYWTRSHTKGGLIIDPNGTPRSVNKKGNDLFVLDESYYEIIQSI